MTEPTYKIVELERPHGFLVWKGKQTAIASDELLPVGEPVLIVDGGEAFGLATLSQPAQMVVSEFDRANWKEMHLTHPDERRRFWPDADRLYVHRIEAFEGYQRPKLFDGEQVIDYEPSEAERKLIAQARQLPKQITLKTDAVVMTDGGFVVCDGAGCDDLTAALKATYQKDPRYIQAGGETELPLYRLALVREPRMVVKKKPEAEATAGKELEINIELEVECDMPYRISERGNQVCVVKEDSGETLHCYDGPTAMEDAQAYLAALSANVEDAAAEGVMDKLRHQLVVARDALGRLLTMAQPEPVAYMSFDGKMLDGKSGVMVKDVNGRPYHFTWSTNAFVDRENEAFSTKALELYVAEAESRDDKGYFDFWHIPGTDFAQKEWQGVVGRFLVEAGPYLDNEAGRKALAFFNQYPTGHPDFAPEGWGSSPEFVYLPEQRATGVYDWVWITRTSTLPKSAAANIYTEAKQENTIMALTDLQKQAAAALFGAEFVQRLENEGAKRTEQLEAAGVAYKGNLTKDAEAETVAEEVETITETAEATAEVETEQPEDENTLTIETEDGQTTTIQPIIELDIEELAAEVSKQFNIDFEPLTGDIAEIVSQIKGLSGRIVALEKALDVKTKTETTRFQVHLKRATEAAETVLDAENENDVELKEKKPKAAHTEGSHANRFFRNK